MPGTQSNGDPALQENPVAWEKSVVELLMEKVYAFSSQIQCKIKADAILCSGLCRL